MKIYKQKSRIFLILSFIFLSVGASAQSQSVELSLSEAIQTALSNNYRIKITDKNVETAKLNNSWEGAGRYPSVNFALSNNNKYNNVPSQVSDGRSEYTTSMLIPTVSLNWNLFNGWAVNITKENLEILEKYAEGNSIVIIENTIQSVIVAYYRALLEKEKLGVAGEVMKLSKDRYEYLLEKKKLGSAVTFDVLQEKNAFLADSANYLMQLLNYDNSIRYINFLLADTTNTVYELTEEFVPVEDEYSYSDLKQKLMQSNSTLRNQYLNQSILKTIYVWPKVQNTRVYQ